MTAPIDFDAWVAEVKAREPISAVAQRLDLDLIGRVQSHGWTTFECPSCGCRDRFGVNDDKGAYHCPRASCGIGGDVIGLVQLVQSGDFLSAMRWLGGDAPLSEDRKRELAKERDRRAEAARKAEAVAARRTAKRMDALLEGCRPVGQVTDCVAARYLRGRRLSPVLDGINGFELSRDVRVHDAAVAFAGPAGARVEVGRFPTLVVIGRDRRKDMACLHRTYLSVRDDGSVTKAMPDLPDGLTLADDWDAKQVLGAAARATHGLYLGATANVTDDPNAPILVGEGNESALSPIAAGVPGVVYAAMNLGRLTGDAQGQGWEPPYGKGKATEHRRPVVILGENDLKPLPGHANPALHTADGRAAYEFGRAEARLRAAGWPCAAVIPTVRADFNDLLGLRDDAPAREGVS